MAIAFLDGSRGLLALRTAGPFTDRRRPPGPTCTASPTSPPVVLVHSDLAHGGQWSAVQALIRHVHDSVALDVRGHGGSEPPWDADYSVEGRAVDVADTVRWLDGSRPGARDVDPCPVVLVGHGTGAAVALSFAAMYPERVAAAVLVDPHGCERSVGRSARRAALARFGGHEYARHAADECRRLAGANTRIARRVANDARFCSQDAILGTRQARWRWNPRPALLGFRGPRVVLWSGVRLPGVPLETIDPTVRVFRVAGTGHWLPVERPALVARFVLQVGRVLAGDAPGR